MDCRRQRGHELEEEAMNSGEMGCDTPKEKGKREATGLCKEKGTGDFFMRGGQEWGRLQLEGSWAGRHEVRTDIFFSRAGGT